MKGFARIFESIIASIILIASLTFFFVLEPIDTAWDNTMLQIISQDALYSAYRNGSLVRFIETNDRVSMNTYMAGLLPSTVEYSVHVKGIPNDVIYVACVDCSGGEKAELLAILNTTEFFYNDRRISIRVENVSIAGQEEPPEGTNILFFFDKEKINNFGSKIDRFLSGGGSIILMSDLTGDESEYIRNIFGISLTSSGPSPAYFPSVYGGNVSHYIAKYYANITERGVGDVEAEEFSFHQSFVNPGDGRDIVRSNVRSFVRANYEVNKTKGRTVWFDDYQRGDHTLPETRKTDNLVKAAIMWASGEDYSMDTVEKNPAPVNFKSFVIVFDKDVYTVELTVWRVFF
jgi:hypothetical protein